LRSAGSCAALRSVRKQRGAYESSAAGNRSRLY
jgi:hypothetical protein